MNGQQIAPCFMYTLRPGGVKKSKQFRYTIVLLSILCLLFLFDLYYLNNISKKSNQIGEEETTHKNTFFPNTKLS